MKALTKSDDLLLLSSTQALTMYSNTKCAFSICSSYLSPSLSQRVKMIGCPQYILVWLANKSTKVVPFNCSTWPNSKCQVSQTKEEFFGAQKQGKCLSSVYSLRVQS